MEADIAAPFVFVISEHDDSKGWVGGVVSEVSRERAAMLITDGEQRLATKEEVEKHFQAVDVEKEKIARMDARNVSNVLADRILGGGQVHRPAVKQPANK